MSALLDHIHSYYKALNTGDPDRVAAHFTDDAVHYYTRLGPHEGARTIGEHTKWAVDSIDGKWHIDNAIEDGEQGTDLSINLIPHTVDNTALHALAEGSRVNLEIDLIARYVERMLVSGMGIPERHAVRPGA